MARFCLAVLIFCVFGAALVKGEYNQEEVAMWRSIIDECKVEVGAKDSEVANIMERKPPTTMEGKCLRLCNMKKVGLIDDNNKYVKDVALMRTEKLVIDSEEQKKTFAEIIDKCAAIKVPNDSCEAAAQYGICFSEEFEAHNIESIYGF